MFPNPYNQFQFPGQFQNPYQNQFQPMNQNQFITKQVSNVEEAKACLVDPLSTYLFVDMNSGKIYMKRMNNNGLSDFYIFAVENPPESKSDPFESINERLINIENILGGKLNVQSVPDNASNAESKPIFDESTSTTKSETFQQGSRNDQRENGSRNQTNGSKHR